MGLEKYAKSLYKCLSKIYLEEKKFIGETTFKYWQKAIIN
ncbi:hypothetical protein GM3709_3161 [Geminocystis sp. NIES-3709]|nr:hypothetical protein GM3709_3161 [Geminocystis sp. NIES-3709]